MYESVKKINTLKNILEHVEDDLKPDFETIANDLCISEVFEDKDILKDEYKYKIITSMGKSQKITDIIGFDYSMTGIIEYNKILKDNYGINSKKLFIAFDEYMNYRGLFLGVKCYPSYVNELGAVVPLRDYKNYPFIDPRIEESHQLRRINLL